MPPTERLVDISYTGPPDPPPIKVKIDRLPPGASVEIQVFYTWRWRLRMWTARALFALATLVLGCPVVVDFKPPKDDAAD